MIVVGAGLRGTIRDICKRCASSHTLGDKPPPMIKRDQGESDKTHAERHAPHLFSRTLPKLSRRNQSCSHSAREHTAIADMLLLIVLLLVASACCRAAYCCARSHERTGAGAK